LSRPAASVGGGSKLLEADTRILRVQEISMHSGLSLLPVLV
jgi:hypothetical protein